MRHRLQRVPLEYPRLPQEYPRLPLEYRTAKRRMSLSPEQPVALHLRIVRRVRSPSSVLIVISAAHTAALSARGEDPTCAP